MNTIVAKTHKYISLQSHDITQKKKMRPARASQRHVRISACSAPGRNRFVIKKNDSEESESAQLVRAGCLESFLFNSESSQVPSLHFPRALLRTL